MTAARASEQRIRELLAAGTDPQEIATMTSWSYAQVVVVAEKVRGEIAALAAETSTPPPADLATLRADARRVVEPRDEVKARIASATELLVRADGVDDRRVRSALSRARKAMTDLAAAMTDYTDRAETRARIVELEQELADAKAALRRPRATAKPATAVRPTTPCSKGCGRQLYAQGRVTHERSCRGAAVAS